MNLGYNICLTMSCCLLPDIVKGNHCLVIAEPFARDIPMYVIMYHFFG